MDKLVISENKRFLQFNDGRPFFYLGDTAWELFHRTTHDEADLYLQDRAEKGFSVIQAVALAELDGLNTPNALGDRPLHDNDPTKPNETYFTYVDFVVRRANELGMFVGMLPTWGDKFNKAIGKGPEIFSVENARVYGEFLGSRYRDSDIIWITGGDRVLETESHLAIVRAMAEGLKSGDNGRHLIAFHPPGGCSSSQFVHAEPWLDFHMIQSGHLRDAPNHLMIDRDYRLLPRRPCMEAEPGYEDHWSGFDKCNGRLDQFDVRKSLYWSLFAGGHGYTYGCHGIWQMYEDGREAVSWARTPWQQSLHWPGSSQVQFARRLIESRPFFSRIPDQTPIVSKIGMAGDHIRATRCRDGSFIMAYLPSGQCVTVDLSTMSGKSIRAWWYDPRTGTAQAIGETFEGKGQREFEPPFNGIHRDWVLVIDDADRNFEPPGSAPLR